MAMAAKVLRTQLNELSLRHKGVLSELDILYSPGRSRKMYTMTTISLYPIRRGSPDVVDILEIWQRNWRGMGLT